MPLIVDSLYTKRGALRDNPEMPPAPESIRRALRVLSVKYLSFDGRIHQGQLVVHAAIARPLRAIFPELLDMGFPIAKMIPVPRYGWDDEESMQDNNSSGYHFRPIAGTSKLSFHALGLALDINPLFNPWMREGSVQPKGATYDPDRPGTLYAGSPVVELFKHHGFDWGGDWMAERGYVDYQHLSFLHWTADGLAWLRANGY
jgi:hypothetical protein